MWWGVYSSGKLSSACAASWGSLTSLAVRPAPKIRKATAHPGPARCSLLGFGDLPGALIELPTSKIREGLQRIQGPRAARFRAPEILLAL